MKYWRKRERDFLVSNNPVHHLLVIICLLIGLPVSIGISAVVISVSNALGLDITILRIVIAGFVGAVFYATAGSVLVGPISGLLWGAVWSLVSILWIFATPPQDLSVSFLISWDITGIIVGSFFSWQLIQPLIRREQLFQRIKK